MPVSAFDEGTINEGIGFDGSSVSSFRRVESGDMCLLPDLDFVILDPFWDYPTLSFNCRIVEADTKKAFAADSREIARKAENLVKKMGLAEKALFGPELEFHLFHQVAYDNRLNASFYSVNSEEAFWNSGEPDASLQGAHIGLKQGYHAAPPRDLYFNLRAEFVRIIEEGGVKIKYHHHEVGGPSQMEIEMFFDTLVKSADAVMWMKYVIKNVSRRFGLSATFMPKPLFEEAGNGMHVHQLLLGPNDEPIFHDEKGYAGLSRTASHYIAGILKHGRALCGLTNPSTNSYKRLVPGYEAPTLLFYSLGNRASAIRIPKYAVKPQKKRLEFRTPDASCNPFLAFAAMLMAGIDGIAGKIEPEKNNMGPFDISIRELDPEIRDAVKPVPEDLERALDSLERDHDFLLRDGVFPKRLIENWIKEKRNREVRQMRMRPTPYEFELYYDI